MAGSETPVLLFENTFLYTEHLQWLLLKSLRFPICNFIKKDTPEKMFTCKFCKIFKNIF